MYTKLLFPYTGTEYEEFEESVIFDSAGNEYEFKFEYIPEQDGTGMIRITDSIGRVMPIDTNHIGQIAQLMLAALGHSKVQATMHQAFQSQCND